MFKAQLYHWSTLWSWAQHLFSETQAFSPVKKSHCHLLFKVIGRIQFYTKFPNMNYIEEKIIHFIVCFCLCVFVCLCLFLSSATRRNLFNWWYSFNSFSYWWHNQQERISYKIQKHQISRFPTYQKITKTSIRT